MPTAAHHVDPADERRHPAGDEPLWNESYYFDFVNDDASVAGYVRLGLYPRRGVAWWTTMVVGPSRPVVASVAYDLAVPEGNELSLHSERCTVELGCDQALRTMSVRADAEAVVYPGALAVYARRQGVASRLGLRLSWATDGVPYHYEVTTRYEIPCLVEGEVTVGAERYAIAGPGQRDHSWGVRDWWAFGWCWAAARLDDGTRVHFADIRIPGMPVGFGYVQTPSGDVQEVTEVTVAEVGGAEGLPDSAVATVQPGGLEIAIDPVAFGPVVFTSSEGRISRFPRAMAHFRTADGRRGTGWIEWNQPQPQPATT